MSLLNTYAADIAAPATLGPIARVRPVSTHVPRLAEFHLADKKPLISPRVVRVLLMAIEYATLAAAGLLIATLYVTDETIFGSAFYGVALVATPLAGVLILEALGLYAVPTLTSTLRQAPRLLFGWTVAVGLLVASVFFLKAGSELSRVWLALWYVTGAALLVADRMCLAAVSRRWVRQGRLNRRAVLVGTGPACGELIRALESDPANDIRICGVFDDRSQTPAADLIEGYPLLGGIDDLVALCRRTRIDLVIVTLPVAAESRILDILGCLSVLPVDVRLAAGASKLRFHPRAYSYIGKVPVIDLFDKPITEWGWIAKAVFDKAAAGVALALLAPVMALAALMIKLDSKGPVLFRQKRYGFNNELIEVFKFRSMFTDRADTNAARLVTRDDARVTRVGRFIRKTSLDELPQLFNVLRGELSLVGPRPHALQAKAANRLYDEVVEGYFARHKVKPGITGWAQINGWRGETDTREKIQKRVEHDLFYIENWSLLLDLYILIRTPFALLKTDNAY